MNNAVMRTESSGVGRLLAGVLRLNLGLAALSLCLTLVRAAVPSVAAVLNAFDSLQVLIWTWVVPVLILVFGVWVYRLHVDLARHFPGYATSPRRALAQCFIPIYFIWGLPKTFSTLARGLILEDGPSAAEGRALGQWTKWLAITIGANLLLYTVGRQYLANPEVLNGALFSVLAAVLNVGQALIWLSITLSVSRVVSGWNPAAAPLGQAVPAVKSASAISFGATALICGAFTFLR